MSRTTDLESFNEALRALNYYRSELENKVSELRQYAAQYADGVDNDDYSQRALSLLDQGLTKINQAIFRAKEIEASIIRKIEEIEASEQILN